MFKEEVREVSMVCAVAEKLDETMPPRTRMAVSHFSVRNVGVVLWGSGLHAFSQPLDQSGKVGVCPRRFLIRYFELLHSIFRSNLPHR